MSRSRGWLPILGPSLLAILLGAARLAAVPGQMAFAHEGIAMHTKSDQAPATELDPRRQAIIPIAAFAAAGDLDGLRQALNQGLDAGLSLAETRELLMQLYAYAGFPRSLNALSELMKVADARRQQGIQDDAGREPRKPIPTGDALLAAGTANQTKLAGAPACLRAFVRFCPASKSIPPYAPLRRHLRARQS